jgi:Tfp pilus assembly protein PilF
MDLEIPKELLRNPHFARYYRTWQKNELSIVFIPLAQICREQGFLETARAICERGLARHPSSVSGRLMLARIHVDADETARAQETVEKVLQEYPAQQEALALLNKINRLEEPEGEGSGPGPSAAVPLAIGVSLWENPTMAKIYADQGETRLARQILDKVLARDPENARAAELKRSLGA